VDWLDLAGNEAKMPANYFSCVEQPNVYVDIVESGDNIE